MGYLIIFGFPIMMLIVAVYTIIDTSIKHKNIDSGLEYYDIPVQARFNGVKCIFASGNYLNCRDYLVWKDDNNILFLEDGYDRITNHWAKKIKIPIEQLEFYSISGAGHYISQNHFDVKNKISVGGAITGGIIAGVPGAILCGRKKTVESSTSTQYIDNHMTEMVLNENGNMTKYCFSGQDMYNILSSYVPHKEYGIYALNQLNQQKKSLEVKHELLHQIEMYLNKEISRQTFAELAEAYYTENAQLIADTKFYKLYSDRIPDICILFVDEPGDETEQERCFHLSIESAYNSLKDLWL